MSLSRMRGRILSSYNLPSGTDGVKLLGISDRLLSYQPKDFPSGLGLSLLSLCHLPPAETNGLSVDHAVILRNFLEVLNIEMTGFEEGLSDGELQELRDFVVQKHRQIRFLSVNQIDLLCEWLCLVKSGFPEMREAANEALAFWEKRSSEEYRSRKRTRTRTN